MRIQSALFGLGLTGFVVAGVVPQSQSDISDADVQANIDQDQVVEIAHEDDAGHVVADVQETQPLLEENDDIKTQIIDSPDVENPIVKDWQHLNNRSDHKHGSKKEHDMHHEQGKHSNKKNHSNHHHHENHSIHDQTDTHSDGKAHDRHEIDKENNKLHNADAVDLHARETQSTAKHQEKWMKHAAGVHVPATTRTSSTVAAAPSKSSSGKHTSTSHATSKPSTSAGTHKPSSTSKKGTTNKPGISSKGKTTSKSKSTKPSSSKKATKSTHFSPNKPGATAQGKANPIDQGPQSNQFLKGPYGPTYDKNNLGDQNHVGDQIDPAQRALWIQQGGTHNRGVPPGSN